MPALLLPLRPTAEGPADPLADWRTAVLRARERALLLDRAGRLSAVSVSAAPLLNPPTLGRHVLDALPVVDFDTGAPGPAYAGRIPPLAVLDVGGLQRGLVRIAAREGAPATYDMVAAALHTPAGALAGALAFLAPL